MAMMTMLFVIAMVATLFAGLRVQNGCEVCGSRVINATSSLFRIMV